MINRLFPIGISICLISIIGIAFLVGSRQQKEIPVKTESVHENSSSTKVSESEDVSIAAERIPLSNTTKIDTDTPIDIHKLKEFLKDVDFESTDEVQQYLNKLKSFMNPDQYAKIEAAQQAVNNWFDGFDFDSLSASDKMPDMDMQEIYDILDPAFGGATDFSEISMDVFRRQFPEGEPADYEQQMAQRIHEIAATTSDDFEEVMLQVMIKIASDTEFTAWTMGQFQGRIGQQIEWMKGEIIASGQMEGIDESAPQDMSDITKDPTGGTQIPSIPTLKPEGVAQNETEDDLSISSNTETVLPVESESVLPTPFAPARITAIQDTLSRQGIKQGMLHLLEYDKEAANWLLNEFGTPAKVEAWLFQQGTTAPTR